MTQANKTQETEASVYDYLDSLENQEVAKDCLGIIDMMRRISGHDPKMWGPSIVGFDVYHYTYESGREGDAPVIGFSPRKANITIYIKAADEARDPDLFSKLGKHSTSKACIYFKRLSDIDVDVLTQIVTKSYRYTKSIHLNT